MLPKEETKGSLSELSRETGRAILNDITNDQGIGHGKRALIMEDNLVNMKIARMVAERVGFSVIEAADGVAGMEQYHKACPDVVLLDLHMPHKDGAEVLSDIRAIDTNTPVIVVTAEVSDGTRREVLAMGANGYLTKPFRQADLISAMQSLTGLERAE